MILLLFAASVVFSPSQQVIENMKELAQSCFHIGQMTQEMIDHPERYRPDAYDHTKQKSVTVCFLKEKLP